ncbi:MAG: mandelate racemase/muconate lactonizing enzyme family protein [Caldilineaceae bacterium]|nr:mandelate racemase/muconate lactonizing enzyme family protein [Caldilineaceae bacterium]
MKITTVETYHLRHRLPHAIGPSTMLYPYRETLLVKLSTDEGLVGWGETAPIGAVQPLIERQLAPLLIGQNPLEHRRLWRQLWGPNFGNPLAVAALDIALHDLRGKALGLSVAELYGGRLRDRVPAYASAMNYTEGREPEEQYPAEATGLVAQGFRALKMRIGGQPVARDMAAAAAVREAVGPEILLMADGNGAYSLAGAIQVGRKLEELNFTWFEEPLPQPDYAGYEVLTDKLDIAIAAGEGLGSRGAFKEVITRRAMDIVQPDVSLCGGFAECLFISEMARLWGVPSVPHCWGGAVVVAATLQLLALLPDASWARTTETPMLELDTYENPFRDAIVPEPVQPEGGFVAVPTGPGLGIEVQEEVIQQFIV